MLKIGIDISKLTIDCAYFVNDKSHHRKFSNNETGFKSLLGWIKNPDSKDGADKTTMFCMEATGIYHLSLAKFLFEKDFGVIVVNPIKTHHFAKLKMMRNKTDKTDALLISQYCEYLDFNESIDKNLWQPKAVIFEDLQYLVMRLTQLDKQKRTECNRLEIASNKMIVKSLKLAIKQLDKQISVIETGVKDLIKANTKLNNQIELLKTIDGIGDKTAWSLLAYAGDMSAFDNANQITSFVGLNPKQRQSGSSVAGSSLSKTGHRKLRKSLYMPALVAIQHNPLLKTYYENLLARGKVKMVAVIAVMRKLLVICYGVLKSGQVFDVDYVKKKQAI